MPDLAGGPGDHAGPVRLQVPGPGHRGGARQPTEGLRGVDPGRPWCAARSAGSAPTPRRPPAPGWVPPPAAGAPVAYRAARSASRAIEHVLGAPSERHTLASGHRVEHPLGRRDHTLGLIGAHRAQLILGHPRQSSGQRERVRGLHRGHRRPTHALEHVAYSTRSLTEHKSYVDVVSNSSGVATTRSAPARGRAKAAPGAGYLSSDSRLSVVVRITESDTTFAIAKRRTNQVLAQRLSADTSRAANRTETTALSRPPARPCPLVDGRAPRLTGGHVRMRAFLAPSTGRSVLLTGMPR